MTPREALGGCIVAAAIVTAPGLAGVLGEAIAPTGDTQTPAARVTGEGPVPQETASAAPLRRAVKASRSRVLIPTPTGTPLDVTCYVATGHRTSSGAWPREGMAASNRYPFGTRLAVEGVGVVTVADRIGWGSDLDLFFNSLSACLHFGRQRLLVEEVR